MRAAALVLGLALLAGCGGSDGPTANPNGRVSPATPASPSATSSPSASATTSPTPSASPSASASASASASLEPSIIVTDYTGFASPSGNILCAVDPDNSYVRCDILEKEWESPPRPPECEFDYGIGFDLEEAGAQFSCVSDAIGDIDLTLEYGQRLAAGGILCESAESGMTCTHTGSKKGFTVARADYALF